MVGRLANAAWDTSRSRWFMLAAMTDEADLRGRIWPLFDSEVPVTAGASGLIGQGDECATWVDAVYIFSSFIVVRTCLIARPERYAVQDHDSVSLVDGGFGIDGPSEVVTTITVDGQPRSTTDRTLHFGGAESSCGRSEASWWLPGIPVARLEVTVEWPRGGLEGRIEFETGDWRNAAGSVLSV
jgi:hypothetical protein